MSSPTWGLFVKNDKIVGCGFCDAGSRFLHNLSIKKCISEVIESCESFINDRDDGTWKRHNGDYLPIYHRYFTSSNEDVSNFDYMIIYQYKISRKVAITAHMLGFTDDEWHFIMEKHVSLMDKNEHKRLIRCL